MVKKGKADAVSLASILHYGIISKQNFEKNSDEGNIEFLKNKNKFGKITPYDLIKLKNYLLEHNIQCRN